MHIFRKYLVLLLFSYIHHRGYLLTLRVGDNRLYVKMRLFCVKCNRLGLAFAPFQDLFVE